MIIYNEPKFGVFNIDINEYDIKVGWIQRPQNIKIIGEDRDCFIERTFISEMPYWDSDGVRFSTIKYCGIGPHKSRLVKWRESKKVDFSCLGEQLTLF